MYKVNDQVALKITTRLMGRQPSTENIFKGTITGIDRNGTVHVKYRNGSDEVRYRSLSGDPLRHETTHAVSTIEPWKNNEHSAKEAQTDEQRRKNKLIQEFRRLDPSTLSEASLSAILGIFRMHGGKDRQSRR